MLLAGATGALPSACGSPVVTADDLPSGTFATPSDLQVTLLSSDSISLSWSNNAKNATDARPDWRLTRHFAGQRAHPHHFLI
jgi:hypothetical protein